MDWLISIAIVLFFFMLSRILSALDIVLKDLEKMQKHLYSVDEKRNKKRFE